MPTKTLRGAVRRTKSTTRVAARQRTAKKSAKKATPADVNATAAPTSYRLTDADRALIDQLKALTGLTHGVQAIRFALRETVNARTKR
jgi:hypothetical protein